MKLPSNDLTGLLSKPTPPKQAPKPRQTPRKSGREIARANELKAMQAVARFGHLRIAELEQRLAELPPGKAVVAYCRGPFCLMSDEAVKLLRQRGYTAHKITDGVSEWRAGGLPIES